MARNHVQKLTVVGVGLLGGSIGLAAKVRYPSVRVAGVGRRSSSLDKALAMGAIDEATLDTAEGVAGADMVILATPMGAYEDHLLKMKPALAKGVLVTDVGSTKALAVRLAESILGSGGPFVGCHPMAGGEQTGVEFARADLFVDAPCIITPTTKTRPALAREVTAFWKTLGAITTQMAPATHDRAVARVSHLPHLLAGLIVMGQKAGSIDLAGNGFLDSTRIASASPAMWREIIIINRKAVLDAIDKADEQLMNLRDLIEIGDGPGIESFFAAAKKRRDALLAKRCQRRE